MYTYRHIKGKTALSVQCETLPKNVKIDHNTHLSQEHIFNEQYNYGRLTES